MAAEAWLEMLHMHFAGILLDSLTSIAAAESELRAAERAEDELRRQYAPLCLCFWYFCSALNFVFEEWSMVLDLLVQLSIIRFEQYQLSVIRLEQ
jgi:hypothetical protein